MGDKRSRRHFKWFNRALPTRPKRTDGKPRKAHLLSRACSLKSEELSRFGALI